MSHAHLWSRRRSKQRGSTISASSGEGSIVVLNVIVKFPSRTSSQQNHRATAAEVTPVLETRLARDDILEFKLTCLRTNFESDESLARPRERRSDVDRDRTVYISSPRNVDS